MLYETDRLREKTTPREQIIYRIQVEGIVGPDDHVHRFEWVFPFHGQSEILG
jgi:paired amphipathic helix protein Sin3a